MEKLIKSKKRVREHAEVFTPEFIVNSMNNLCEPDISDIYKRVFEPSCGEGAFLTNVLKRRLKKCNNNFERLIALSNIYGVDIQEDNVYMCQVKLLHIMLNAEDGAKNLFEVSDYVAAARQILSTNIVAGDTINKPDKIVFTKYEPTDTQDFKVSEHCLNDMI